MSATEIETPSPTATHPNLAFGSRLQSVVATARLTQAEFAARIPCSTSFLGAMLRGEKLPGGEMLLSIKREFGISLDWLLDGDGTMLSGGELDVGRYRLHVALLELARLKEVDADPSATRLVQAFVDGQEQVDQLSDGALEILQACQESTRDRVFEAALYSDHSKILSNQEWAVATLRTACTNLKLRHPLRVKPSMTATERLNRGATGNRTPSPNARPSSGVSRKVIDYDGTGPISTSGGRKPRK